MTFPRFQVYYERPLPEPTGSGGGTGDGDGATTAHRGRKIECGYCLCTLAPNGDVLAMSKRAKEIREADDEHERVLLALRRELEAEQTAHTATKAELTKAREVAPHKGFLDDL